MMESRCGVGKVWICILMQIGPAKIEGADQRCWFCCVDEVHDVCIINVESKFFCWRRVREAFCARAVFVITSVFGWLDVCKATYESKHDEVPLIKMNNEYESSFWGGLSIVSERQLFKPFCSGMASLRF